MRRVGLLALASIAGLAGLAGCGGGGSATTAAHTPAPPAPLSIQERAATGSLAGLPPETAPAERRTPAEFAADLGRGISPQDIDALTRAGYVTGAVRTFRKGSAAAAFSFVVQAASAERARALMRDLTAVDPSYTTPHDVQRGALPAVPGSVVVDVHFTPRGGVSSELVRVGFTDGPFVYLESSARVPHVASAALARDALRLYRRVRGRPAP
jgi:hypothetical protein